MPVKTACIAITGPESTGKSTLTSQLGNHYVAPYCLEYARDYIAGLNRRYTYEDVIHIAKTQILQVKRYNSLHAPFVFMDTYLEITKVWLEVVFNRCPPWINDELKSHRIDLYLLCDTSLPWIPDDIRENGGEMRDKLFIRYREILEENGYQYGLVTGTEENRFLNAVEIVDHFFS